MEMQNKKSALVFALLLAAAAGCDENRNDQTDTGTAPGSNMTDNERTGVSSPRGNTGTNSTPDRTTTPGTTTNDPSRPNPTNPGTMSPTAEPGTTTPSPNVNPTSPGTSPGTSPSTDPSNPQGVPGSQPSPTPPTPGGTERDEQITQEIRALIRNDSTLSTLSESIEVQTRAGVVTLTGRVTSRAELDAIEERVRQVAGVTSVNNNLEIEPR